MKTASVSLLLFILFAACNRLPAQETRPEAAATLVVFNSRDPLSEQLAQYYAKRRHIPADQVVGLDCPVDETIGRNEYDATIAEPLRKIFSDRGWWKLNRISDTGTRMEKNKIRFVALIRGMPLRISQTAGYAGDKPGAQPEFAAKNEASVDSELACLGFFTRTISGPLGNPYYRNFMRIADANLPQLMLVCRLDAITGETVRRMIDDSIEAEQKGVWGFAYIDSRNIKEGGLAEGDTWLLHLAEEAKKSGIPVIQESGPELFPDNYPMRYTAFYYGWYAENICGPFLNPGFRFSKGAVACHIHSFSASTLRDPARTWAGPLLERGAVAVLGNVYEPFLALTANLDIFHERLHDGFTFAESAYMSVRVVSWMNTCIGDPLYRPFKAVPDDVAGAPKPISEFAAYREGALAWHQQGRAIGERKLLKAARALRSGIIFESLGLLQARENDFDGALDSFKQARRAYVNGDDIIRAALHEIGILRALNKNAEAHAVAQKVLQAESAASAAALLRKIDVGIPQS